MAHTFSFTTGKFDVSKETPNDINPIAGQGVLNWIREKLAGSAYASTEPSTEDWGWCMDVAGRGSTYLVGASGEPERPPRDVDWVIQVHKNRSMMEKLTGKRKLTPDDPFSVLLEKLLRDEPSFGDISVEKEA